MKLTEIANQQNQASVAKIYNLCNRVVSNGVFDVNPDTLVVDVHGSVDIDADFLINGKLPVVFGKVTGTVGIQPNVPLVSLEGMPREVGGSFNIQDTQISSFVGGPDIVHGAYMAYGINELTSLQGLPPVIGGALHLGGCPALTSLEHLPHSIGLGKKDTAFAGLFLTDTGIKSFHNFHKTNGNLKVRGSFAFTSTASHLLSLLLIPGIKTVWAADANLSTILNKHLKGERDIHACQEELIDAGYTAQARI